MRITGIMLKKKWLIILTLCSLTLIGCVMAGPIMSNVETPKYNVSYSSGNIEHRNYEPMIIAAVEVTGERKESIGNGFRLIADYIFGNNSIDQNIKMTAPVEQQTSKKIAMTAPVQQQQSGASWTISFVMPSEYTLSTIPKPNREEIKLTLIASKEFIVIRFSGTNSDELITKYQTKLLSYIAKNKIKIVGEPKYAFYNPPWTLPFMRRNEIMFEVLSGE
jgi:hypothetical protein